MGKGGGGKGSWKGSGGTPNDKGSWKGGGGKGGRAPEAARGKGSGGKGQQQKHTERIQKSFGLATLEGLNLDRRGTVELDPENTGGWNAWVRYSRDDKKNAWISQTELSDALMRMEDDQATYLEGLPSPDAVYNQQGRALAALAAQGKGALEKGAELLAILGTLFISD